MIILEFQMRQEPFTELQGLNYLAIDAGVLQETCFVLPVRLAANNTELFEQPRLENQGIWISSSSRGAVERLESKQDPSIWLPLPVIDVALVGLEKVKEACGKGSSAYSLPQTGAYLRFELTNGWLRVRSTLNQREILVSCTDLQNAFEKFSSDVRQLLSRILPELRKHPQLGDWLSQ